jgi:hypothetical protein
VNKIKELKRELLIAKKELERSVLNYVEDMFRGDLETIAIRNIYKSLRLSVPESLDKDYYKIIKKIEAKYEQD